MYVYYIYIIYICMYIISRCFVSLMPEYNRSISIYCALFSEEVYYIFCVIYIYTLSNVMEKFDCKFPFFLHTNFPMLLNDQKLWCFIKNEIFNLITHS